MRTLLPRYQKIVFFICKNEDSFHPKLESFIDYVIWYEGSTATMFDGATREWADEVTMWLWKYYRKEPEFIFRTCYLCRLKGCK